MSTRGKGDRTLDQEPLIAVFIDFENVALGRPAKGTDTDFDVSVVLNRLLEKGRIVYKRAYCDWSRFQKSTRSLHENGVELIDIPRSRVSGKNSADIRMVVDAIDLCYAKQHIDLFALITGDSDFSPLVAKLKENDKRVLGCGVRNATSQLLINSCDEFLIYDDLVEKKKKIRSDSVKKGGDKKEDAFARIEEVVESLGNDHDVVWGSMVKQALRRISPDFSESKLGYRNFAEFLEAAEDAEHVSLDYDENRGNYEVRLAKRGSKRGGSRSGKKKDA